MKKQRSCDVDDKDEALAAKRRPVLSPVSEERRCAEALMMACIERLGAQSPAALMVCDTHLARDFWMNVVHPPPAASQVWAWGSNNWGQLGLEDLEERTMPTEVTALHGRRIHAVACGGEHTMAVVDDGELWATGMGYYGELGLGERSARNRFTHVSALSGKKVTAVACGGAYTLAMIESGELFVWGCNEEGQLGLGDKETIDRKTPEPVAALSGRRVAAIACGGIHSVVVLETGELFAWGDNFRGQLGLGDNAYRSVPTHATALADKHIFTVVCGVDHTAAVTESGELFTWGNNEDGQLGHGDLTFSKNTPQLVEALRGRPVIAVACGENHTLALLKTGEVFAWGERKYGELGLGKDERDSIGTPQQVHFFDDKRVMSIHCGGRVSGAVLESGELFVWGTGDSMYITIPTLIANLAGKRVLSVAIGCAHTLALVE